MMHGKDIERLYREQFREFEPELPAQSWERLSLRLHQQTRRHTSLTRYRYISIAASLLLLLSLNHKNQTPSSATGLKSKSIIYPEVVVSPSSMIPDQDDRFHLPAFNELFPADQTAASHLSNSSRAYSKYPQPAALNSYIHSQSYASTANPVYIRSKTMQIASELRNSNTFLAAEHELFTSLSNGDEEQQNQKTNRHRWSISPQMGPVYYQSFTGGSPLDPRLASNVKSGGMNMSYGLKVAYQLDKHISLRWGINKLDLGYDTENIDLSSTASTWEAANIAFNPGVTTLAQLTPKATGTGSSQSRPISIPQGTLQQELGYVEIPLEMKYRFGGEKIGLHVVGGMSSLILTNNSIQLDNGSSASSIGEATNLNAWNFSTNLGLGLDYRFTPKWEFNLEPMFKYQWNTFSGNSGGFSPYILGVHTGFSFKF